MYSSVFNMCKMNKYNIMCKVYAFVDVGFYVLMCNIKIWCVIVSNAYVEFDSFSENSGPCFIRPPYEISWFIRPPYERPPGL